jgi:hypothetical protein
LKNVLIEDKSKYLAEMEVLREKHKTELHELYMKNKKQIEETNNYLIQLDEMRNDSRNSDGKTYKSLYERTIKRDEEIRAAGYNLVTMWETTVDFKII